MTDAIVKDGVWVVDRIKVNDETVRQLERHLAHYTTIARVVTERIEVVAKTAARYIDKTTAVKPGQT